MDWPRSVARTLGLTEAENLLGNQQTLQECYDVDARRLVKVYFSAAHILSRKGLKGMKPSSSSGSQRSFIRFLASSLVSFSPRVGSSLKSSWPSMVSSLFLSYSFRISTKSWKLPWSLESLQALYMGNTSAFFSCFFPFSDSPPTSAMVLRVGLRLQARMRSPA